MTTYKSILQEFQKEYYSSNFMTALDTNNLNNTQSINISYLNYDYTKRKKNVFSAFIQLFEWLGCGFVILIIGLAININDSGYGGYEPIYVCVYIGIALICISIIPILALYFIDDSFWKKSFDNLNNFFVVNIKDKLTLTNYPELLKMCEYSNKKKEWKKEHPIGVLKRFNYYGCILILCAILRQTNYSNVISWNEL